MSTSSKNRAIVRYTNEETAGTSGGTSSGSDHSNETSAKRRKNQSNDVSIDPHLAAEDIDRVVSDCVKYLLICDHKKSSIKRVDLFKAVLKHSPNRKAIEEIMEKIKRQLSDTFGIELAEVPEVPNTYILVNKLPTNGLKEAIDSQSIPDQQLLETSLLTTVLSMIFMSGETVHEEKVWKFLTKLGFDTKSKTKTIQIENESNGITIKKLLTELWVRQLYLKYQKIPRSDPIAHEFKWGFRADKEFSKMDILRFVCDIFADGTQPEFWRTQYAIAQQDTLPNTDNDAEVEVIP